MPRPWMMPTGDRLRREWWAWGWEEGVHGLPPQRFTTLGLPAGLVDAYDDGYDAGEGYRRGGWENPPQPGWENPPT